MVHAAKRAKSGHASLMYGGLTSNGIGPVTRTQVSMYRIVVVVLSKKAESGDVSLSRHGPIAAENQRVVDLRACSRNGDDDDLFLSLAFKQGGSPDPSSQVGMTRVELMDRGTSDVLHRRNLWTFL